MHVAQRLACHALVWFCLSGWIFLVVWMGRISPFALSLIGPILSGAFVAYVNAIVLEYILEHIACGNKEKTT